MSFLPSIICCKSKGEVWAQQTKQKNDHILISNMNKHVVYGEMSILILFIF